MNLARSENDNISFSVVFQMRKHSRFFIVAELILPILSTNAFKVSLHIWYTCGFAVP